MTGQRKDITVPHRESLIIMKDANAARNSDDPARDERLVQRAISGDADAFASLYDDYADRVYRFALFRVSDVQTAEDLTSQVFLKAWENLNRFQLRGAPFSAWLFRVARNTIIDHYRTRKETLPLEAALSVGETGDDDVDARVERQQEADWLRAALQRLTEDQRQVLSLRFIEGLSTKEIATVMGKQEGAVRALQMRGLQALADIIWRSNG